MGRQKLVGTDTDVHAAAIRFTSDGDIYETFAHSPRRRIYC